MAVMHAINLLRYATSVDNRLLQGNHTPVQKDRLFATIRCTYRAQGHWHGAIDTSTGPPLDIRGDA